jgi:Na+/citrate or Na+/malate symporter
MCILIALAVLYKAQAKNRLIAWIMGLYPAEDMDVP